MNIASLQKHKKIIRVEFPDYPDDSGAPLVLGVKPPKAVASLFLYANSETKDTQWKLDTSANILIDSLVDPDTGEPLAKTDEDRKVIRDWMDVSVYQRLQAAANTFVLDSTTKDGDTTVPFVEDPSKTSSGVSPPTSDDGTSMGG